MQTKAIVTGGLGFIGSNLIKLLLKSNLIKLLPINPKPPVTMAFVCIKISYSNEKIKYTFFLNKISDKYYHK